MSDKREAATLALKERTRGKRFKLPEGDTTFRILPNAENVQQREFAEYGMHSEVGPRKAYLKCGKSKSGKGACWLCDTVIPKLESSGKSSHTQLAERMARKEVFAVQIAFKDDDTGKWIGPVLWQTPNSVTQALLAIMGRHDISNPESGYNLTISRSGTGMKDTRYGQIDRDSEASEVPESIITKLKPFKEVIRKYDERGMKAAYSGHDIDEDDEESPSFEEEAVEEDDEEETPKAKAGKKKPVVEEDEEDEVPVKPKGKKKPVEDENDLDEEVEIEEDEEDEKPKGKKKTAPAEDEETEFEEEEDEVEEDEETPDLEDEEEEKPKGKKSKKPVEDEDEEDEEPVKPKAGKKKPAKPADDDDDF